PKFVWKPANTYMKYTYDVITKDILDKLPKVPDYSTNIGDNLDVNDDKENLLPTKTTNMLHPYNSIGDFIEYSQLSPLHSTRFNILHLNKSINKIYNLDKDEIEEENKQQKLEKQ